MKTLVTGATGFIGSRLCRKLKAEGHAIRALILPGESTTHIDAWIDETHQGDITNPATLKRIGADVDLVYHLAARVLDYGTREQFYRPIFNGTHHVLLACADHAARFVHVSSFAACGVGRHLRGLTEQDPIKKSGVPYNDSKLDAEALVKGFSSRFSNGCVIIRPSNVVGPGSVWVAEVGRQLKHALVPLIDGGRHSTSFVHVDNLVDALVLAGTTPAAAGQIYFIRDDWQVSWKHYLTDLGEMVGKKPVGNIPFFMAWNLGKLAESICLPFKLRPPVTRMAAALMGRDNDVDTSKAKHELGWQTKVTYQQALTEIRPWVQSRT